MTFTANQVEVDSSQEPALWTREERLAFVVKLTKELQRTHGRVGRTHIQKSAYFLEHLLRVPTGYRFVLHQFGPYSFALDADLAELQAVGWMDVRPDSMGYGAQYRPTEAAERLLAAYGRAAESYAPQIGAVARRLGGCPAHRLELLATALYVRENAQTAEQAEMVGRLRQLKPHFGEGVAREGFEALERLPDELAAAATG